MKYEVWSVKKAMRSVDCEVWSLKCEVWMGESAVGSVKCVMWIFYNDFPKYIAKRNNLLLNLLLIRHYTKDSQNLLFRNLLRNPLNLT